MSRWSTKPRWQDHQLSWLTEATDRADHLVQDHPLASAGTIFALGLIIGCAVGLSVMALDRTPPPAPRRRTTTRPTRRTGARS